MENSLAYIPLPSVVKMAKVTLNLRNRLQR